MTHALGIEVVIIEGVSTTCSYTVMRPGYKPGTVGVGACGAVGFEPPAMRPGCKSPEQLDAIASAHKAEMPR